MYGRAVAQAAAINFRWLLDSKTLNSHLAVALDILLAYCVFFYLTLLRFHLFSGFASFISIRLLEAATKTTLVITQQRT